MSTAKKKHTHTHHITMNGIEMEGPNYGERNEYHTNIWKRKSTHKVDIKINFHYKCTLVPTADRKVTENRCALDTLRMRGCVCVQLKHIGTPVEAICNDNDDDNDSIKEL